MAYFKTDSDIHHELNIRCQKILTHPFLELIKTACFSPSQMASLCGVKQKLRGGFLESLGQAKAMAEAAGKPKLAMALQVNLADERGVDPVTGELNGLGSHHSWAQNFYDALDAEAPGYINSEELFDNSLYQFNLFRREHDASLDFIVGMIMATEKCVPIDYAAWLKAICSAFPSLEIQGKTGPLFFWVDHIKHEEERHLPDLVDGYLGRDPGSSGYNIMPSDILAGEAKCLLEGIDLSISLRMECYDLLLAGVNDSFSKDAASAIGSFQR